MAISGQIVSWGIGEFGARALLASIGLIAISACATPEVEPGARQAAEYMGDVLKAMPSTEDAKVEINHHSGRGNPLVDVSYPEKSGVRGRTWLEVEPGPTDYFVMYPFRENNETPLTDDVIKTLETRCKVYVDVVLITR